MFNEGKFPHTVENSINFRSPHNVKVVATAACKDETDLSDDDCVKQKRLILKESSPQPHKNENLLNLGFATMVSTMHQKPADKFAQIALQSPHSTNKSGILAVEGVQK